MVATGMILDVIRQEMEDGVYDFTKDGQCSGCGSCCSRFLPVSGKEVKAIRRYVRKKKIQEQRHLYPIRTIYGMTGAESIPVLKKAIAKLESMTVDISDEECRECEGQGATGYWMPTRENAIRPLYQLLAFAQMRPDGVWEGD